MFFLCSSLTCVLLSSVARQQNILAAMPALASTRRVQFDLLIVPRFRLTGLEGGRMDELWWGRVENIYKVDIIGTTERVVETFGNEFCGVEGSLESCRTAAKVLKSFVPSKLRYLPNTRIVFWTMKCTTRISEINIKHTHLGAEQPSNNGVMVKKWTFWPTPSYHFDISQQTMIPHNYSGYHTTMQQ